MGVHASVLEPGDTINPDVVHFTQWPLKKVKKCHDRYGKTSKTPGVGPADFNMIFDLDEGDSKSFAAFDTDQNQKVDVNEVFGMVATCAKGTLSKKLKMIYQLFDFDQSGALNEYESESDSHHDVNLECTETRLSHFASRCRRFCPYREQQSSCCDPCSRGWKKLRVVKNLISLCLRKLARRCLIKQIPSKTTR